MKRNAPIYKFLVYFFAACFFLIIISLSSTPFTLSIIHSQGKISVYYGGKKINETEAMMGRDIYLNLAHNRSYTFLPPHLSVDSISVISDGKEIFSEKKATSLREKVRQALTLFHNDYPINGSFTRFNDISLKRTIVIRDLPLGRAFELTIRGQNISEIEALMNNELTVVFLRPDWHHENIIRVDNKVYGGGQIGMNIRDLTLRYVQNISILLVFTFFALAGGQVFLLMLNMIPFIVKRTQVRKMRDDDRRGFFPKLPITLVHSAIFAGLLLYTAIFIFDMFPHTQDEVVYLFQSKLIANGFHLFINPLPGEIKHFFDHEFIVNKDKWFGMYTNGTPMLLALGQLIRAPYIINPLISLGTLLLLNSFLRRQKVSSVVFLFANLFFIISPFQLLIGGSYMSHAVSQFATLLVFIGSYILSPWMTGIGLGMLLIIRPYNSVVMGVWFVLWVLLSVTRFKLREILKKATVIRLMRLYGLSFLFTVPFIVFQLMNNVLVTGSVFEFPLSAYSPYNTIGFGLRGIEWESLFTVEKAIELSLFNVLSLLDIFQPLPFFLSFFFICIGLGSLRNTQHRILIVACASIFLMQVLAYVPFHGNGAFYGPRYWFEVNFALILLSALGVETVCLRLFLHYRRGAALFLTVLLFFSYAGFGFPRTLGILQQFKGYNGISPPLEIQEKLKGERAIVFIKGSDSWQKYGAFFVYLDPFMEGDIIFARYNAMHNVAKNPKIELPNRMLIEKFPHRKLYVVETNGKLRDYQPSDDTL